MASVGGYGADVDIDVIVQTVTPVLVVLTIIWHQQRSTEKLRDDFTQANDKLRDDFTQADDKLRDDLTKANRELRDDLTKANRELRDDVMGALGELARESAENGQRLARIEGFLGVGMPPDIAERAAGATVFPAEA